MRVEAYINEKTPHPGVESIESLSSCIHTRDTGVRTRIGDTKVTE